MRMPIDGYDGDRKRLVGATGRDKKPSCASPQQIEDKQAKTPLKKLPRSRCLLVRVCISQRKSTTQRTELAASVRQPLFHSFRVEKIEHSSACTGRTR